MLGPSIFRRRRLILRGVALRASATLGRRPVAERPRPSIAHQPRPGNVAIRIVLPQPQLDLTILNHLESPSAHRTRQRTNRQVSLRPLVLDAHLTSLHWLKMPISEWLHYAITSWLLCAGR